ncbi:MAG: tRNA glutamyl-Q(34) synthetase GluQRS [Methylophilaceae bacterium]|nr:tRNA glutamyl-Q(34) synthetase GluQRS [Methylophilaceae bacterium]
MIGRFAPSPTGPLHFGSLLAALASYLEAKTQGGLWLVRMEDLDKPREVAGAANHILNTLEKFGLEWDGEVVYQSQRSELYQEALNQIKAQSLIYQCSCSRKEIADSYNQKPAQHGIDGLIYPGTCRDKSSTFKPYAERIKVKDQNISFNDAIQGKIDQNLANQIGDFVLKRADGLFAYQLAVVVDDYLQGVTHVVRGADLLDSTPRQIYLQQVLGYSTPKYAHIPVASNQAGEKLSKQTLATPIDANNAPNLLINALDFLGQTPPQDLSNYKAQEILAWAMQHWALDKIPKQRSIIFE